MNRKSFPRLIMIVLCLILLWPMTLSVGQGPRRGPAPEVFSDPNQLVVYEVPESQLARAPLTQEQMANAIPMPMPQIVFEGELKTADPEPRLMAGNGALIPAKMPDPDAVAAFEALFDTLDAEEVADEWCDECDRDIELMSVELMTSYYDDYPPPFSRYDINRWIPTWRRFPWTTMGKLYVSIPGDPPDAPFRSCSASVGADRAIWTAAHCLYTPGKGWNTVAYFVPAYRHRVAPLFIWPVARKTVLTGWFEKGNYAYDIGMVSVHDTYACLGDVCKHWKISELTGRLGFMSRVSRVQSYHSFGYPNNLRDGEYLIATAASTSRIVSWHGPNPVGIGTDMGDASSGGPRIVLYKPFADGPNNFVNGVNGFFLDDKSFEVYHSYFTIGAENLYAWGQSQ